MTEFKVHDLASAPADAKPLLEAAQQAFGMVPNLFGVFAEAPALLEAYQAVGLAFGKTSLSPVEQQVVLLSVSFTNGCDYCMAAHSAIAGMQQVPEGVVEALRAGRPIADPRLEALRRFTAAIVAERGWVDEGAVAGFLAAGFERRHVLEVVLGVGMKTLSNYTNHIAHTPLDQGFQSQAWARPAETV